MATYYLPVNDDQALCLTMARVLYCPFNIGNDHGVIFNSDADLQNGLTALGVQEDPEQRTPTEYSGVIRIALQGQDRRPGRPRPNQPTPMTNANRQVVVPNRLEVAEWNGRNQGTFMQILQQHLLPVITNKKIVLHAPHGSRPQTPQINDDCFHIWFWGSPINGEAIVPGTLWGIIVDARNAGYQPSGLGTAILDSSGWPVGELVGDNFYIHWDCCETGSTHELNIFGHMMEALALAIEYPGKTPKQIVALKANSVILKQRRQYIAACGKRMGDFLTQIRATHEAKSVQILALQEQLAQAIREQDFAREQLTGLESGNNLATSRFGDEFDRLLATEGVCDLEIVGDELKVYTDILFCRDSRNRNHEIGEFIITIPLSGHGSVNWHNQTCSHDGHDAPHVRGGQPCLGNMQTVFPQLIGKFEFAALVSMAIAFVQSVNENDLWGRTITEWPVVRHNDPVRPATKRQRRTPVPMPPDTPRPTAGVTPPEAVAAETAPEINSMTHDEIERLLANLTLDGSPTPTPATTIPTVTIDTDADFDPEEDDD